MTTPTVPEQFCHLFERSILCVKSEAERNTYVNTGRAILYQTIERLTKDNVPLGLVLPAFPFKSPNSAQKVLGTRPDAGEEVALKRMEDFCVRVEKFYAPGCKCVVFSDGRVFNDLLGVEDETVATYNQVCHEIVTRNNLTHISFDSLENYTKAQAHPELMDNIMRDYLPKDFDVKNAIKHELKGTYLGFRSFLVLDLAIRWGTSGPNGQPVSKKEMEDQCKHIAQKMISRNQAFSSLVSVNYPNHLRLSIHAGNLQGPKWSISLINNKPNSTTCASATPWHNVPCLNNDGEVYAVRRHEVDMSKYSLVMRDGHPWAFAENEGGDSSSPVPSKPLKMSHSSICAAFEGCTLSPDTTNVPFSEPTIPEPSVPFKVKDAWKHIYVDFELLKPFGVLIRAKTGASFFDVPKDSLRELVCTHTTVVLRGFAHMSKEEYIEGVKRLGNVVVNPHGVITDVKEENDPKISVFTKEAMPVHFDGMFKIKMDNSVDPPKPVADIPFMQIFQCVVPPAPTDEGGLTLFIDTRKILATFTSEEIEQMKKLRVAYYMPPAGMFGGKWMDFTMVDVHPITGENILRIHEPWPTSKSEKFEIKMKPFVESEEPLVNAFFERIMPLCFDERFSFKQKWELDDLLFADNHAQLHTRTSYTTASRHLRRIHIQD